LECRWDSLEDEWHSNDNSIVALKKILLLEWLEDLLKSAPVTLWSPFCSKEVCVTWCLYIVSFSSWLIKTFAPAFDWYYDCRICAPDNIL
jgi:hypothetical protein